MSFSTYQGLIEAINNDIDGLFELVLDYSDFQVFRDTASGRYYYVECGENDADEFFEVECVATLYYDITHDLQIDLAEAGSILSQLFDCDICGEAVLEDHFEYLWFKRKPKE